MDELKKIFDKFGMDFDDEESIISILFCVQDPRSLQDRRGS